MYDEYVEMYQDPDPFEAARIEAGIYMAFWKNAQDYLDPILRSPCAV
jgi:hypothetical protein